MRIDCASVAPKNAGVDEDVRQEIDSLDNNTKLDVNYHVQSTKVKSNFTLFYDQSLRHDKRFSIKPNDKSAKVEDGVVGQIFLITEVSAGFIF